MTKDELKQEAARLGVKVKEGFMDDPAENLAYIAAGIFIGFVLGKLI